MLAIKFAHTYVTKQPAKCILFPMYHRMDSGSCSKLKQVDSRDWELNCAHHTQRQKHKAKARFIYNSHFYFFLPFSNFIHCQ